MHVAWIPSEFAIEGNILKIKENGEWEEGWNVTGVGFTKDDTVLVEMHRVVRNHRRYSDLPQGTFK